ncbi:MAG TPA: SPOR domain-containing protein [Luteimonas sp.]|nr:SPOR domain-containing protein [Luteimonas sp.]
MPVRALIVLLLILNLGVALWWITRDDAAPSEAPALPQGVERLQLLEEAAPPPGSTAAIAEAPDDEAPQSEDDAPAAADSPPAAASACHALGPFPDAATAERAAAQLRPAVQRLAMRESRAAPRGWNVLLPRLADRDAAAAAATRLAAAGFGDHYLMPAAADGTVDIALGRFGSEAPALRHQAALRAAGFEAVAAPIGDAGDARYWIDVAASADADLAGLRRASGATRSEAIDCATLPAPVR